MPAIYAGWGGVSDGRDVLLLEAG